jgi:hypothetical protein
MRKFTFFVFSIGLLILVNTTLSANQTIFQLTYCEWPDGCLTYENNRHYSGINLSHRNDNTLVNGLINDFNNYVRRYNVVPYQQGQRYYAGTYVYIIDKSSLKYSPALGGINGGNGKPRENYTIYACRIVLLE